LLRRVQDNPPAADANRQYYPPTDAKNYFNVRSKADKSQLNLPHGTKKTKKVEKKN